MGIVIIFINQPMRIDGNPNECEDFSITPIMWDYMRKYLISSIVAIAFIVIIMSLGFGIKDDYFMWAFPSLPFIIGCFENCGAVKVSIATISNGILIGLILLGILSVIDKNKKI